MQVLDTEENRSPNAEFWTISGDSMLPVLVSGWLVRVDTSLISPMEGDIVVIHIEGEGKLVGCWRGGETPGLTKANPAYESVDLNARGKPWRVWGIVTHVTSKPVLPRRRTDAGDSETRCQYCHKWFDESDLNVLGTHSRQACLRAVD